MRIELDLSPELACYVAGRVREDDEASASDFVRECIELRRIGEIRRRAKLRRLRQWIRESPGVTGAAPPFGIRGPRDPPSGSSPARPGEGLRPSGPVPDPARCEPGGGERIFRALIAELEARG